MTAQRPVQEIRHENQVQAAVPKVGCGFNCGCINDAFHSRMGTDNAERAHRPSTFGLRILECAAPGRALPSAVRAEPRTVPSSQRGWVAQTVSTASRDADSRSRPRWLV